MCTLAIPGQCGIFW